MWEVVEDRLSHQRTMCCAWNRRGTLLACGTSSGTIVIWCWDTRAPTREFRAESDDDGGERAAVLSVHWSLDGRKIVAAKSDGRLEVWDVLDEDVSAVLSNVGLCSSALFAASAPKGTTLIVSPSVGKSPYVRGTSLRGQRETEIPSPHDAPVTGLALSSKNGKYIFVGDARGTVSVVEQDEMRLVQSIAVPNATLVKRLELCRNGKHLLAVTNAQTICGFDVDDSASSGDVLANAREYESPSASRLQWGEAAYPWNGEYVYGVSNGAAHEIHVWDRATGALKCVLEGPAESKGIVQLSAHPIRDIGVALGANGNLYVWSRKYKEDWAAFDPSFKTLVDNKEYVEKEDEFDVKPSTSTAPKQPQPYTIDVDNLPECLFKKVNYYTDESGDDVLHGLPPRIEPDPELEKVMAARREKWDRKAKRREKRKAEDKAAAKEAKGTPASEKQ